ncbi:hypothetical protein Ddc_17079 [Ditylenchus destructor]|nr:hypothetical protein Ddc_17079 [Ditylenchus destructor]
MSLSVVTLRDHFELDPFPRKDQGKIGGNALTALRQPPQETFRPFSLISNPGSVSTTCAVEARLELKLAQDNSNGMDHYKASTQREIENLRNSLDAEIKQRRKTESELKSAQETLEELRRDKAEAEKALTRPGQASWLSTTFIVLILLYLTLVVVGSFYSNGINTLNCLFLLSLSFVVGAWLAVPWYYVTLVVLCWVTFIKIFADNSSKS